jgi:hypothetical protein
MGVVLALGCSKPNDRDPEPKPKCSTKTLCNPGYECDFGTQNPLNPSSIGTCKYAAVCGLTDLCKKPQACLPQEQAMCDRLDNDHFCHCATPTSQDVPVTPTTGTPTTDPPTTGDKP